MRLALSGQQYFRAFTDSLLTAATQESAMIEEELQQGKVRCAQLVTQEEIIAQPRLFKNGEFSLRMSG